VEGDGIPTGVVEGVNRHDMKPVRSTLDSLILERPEPTKEEQQGMYVVCLDADYAYEEVREILRAFGFTAHFSLACRRSPGPQAGSGLHSAALGGGTGASVAVPLSAPADPLGQEGMEVSGVAAFRVLRVA
jgi:hypothetical protein